MDRVFRISAGAIVVDRGRLLLVRYRDASGGRGYLVAPGGGIESDEGLAQTAVRETKEETGIEVVPTRIICVEDLISRRKRIVKTWFLCRKVGGRLARTPGAAEEGIVEVGWYRRPDLDHEVVYPAIVLGTDWSLLAKPHWETRHIESRDPESDF